MDKLRSSSIMSQGFGNVYKKVLKDKRLTKVAKLIHCYLCSYAGSGDTAFPSVSLICHDLDISDNTYYEHIQYLKAYGYITVEQMKNEQGKFKNNVYVLEMYPEQCENEELIAKIKNKKESKKPTTKNLGTDKPTTKIRGTENLGTNTNSSKTLLLYIWDKAKEKLSKQLAEHTYNDFVGTLTPFSYEDSIFTFLCPDEWLKAIIEMRYIDNIHIALGEVCKLHNINEFKIQIKV